MPFFLPIPAFKKVGKLLGKQRKGTKPMLSVFIYKAVNQSRKADSLLKHSFYNFDRPLPEFVICS